MKNYLVTTQSPDQERNGGCSYHFLEATHRDAAITKMRRLLGNETDRELKVQLTDSASSEVLGCWRYKRGNMDRVVLDELPHWARITA